MAFWMIGFAALGGVLTLLECLLAHRKSAAFVWVLLCALLAATAVPLTGLYMVNEWTAAQEWSSILDCVPAMTKVCTWYFVFIALVNGLSVFHYQRGRNK